MRILFLFVIAVAALACTNNAKNSRGKNSKGVFYDCQVWAEEGNPEVNITFRYHTGKADDSAAKAEQKGYALLDGTPMDKDSSNYNGTVYEASKPLQEFAGQHVIRFADKSGREQKEEFAFQPFTLAEEIPEQQKKVPFVLALKNFPPEPSLVRLVMTDTSFNSRDVNEEIQVENGEIRITAGQLANLVTGPVTLEIYREDERPLKQSKETGRILVMYALRRQFELVD